MYRVSPKNYPSGISQKKDPYDTLGPSWATDFGLLAPFRITKDHLGPYGSKWIFHMDMDLFSRNSWRVIFFGTPGRTLFLVLHDCHIDRLFSLSLIFP